MILRVLIADDEELERRALRSILSAIEQPRLELLEAANGRQAIELAESTVLDLAFLDIRMPGMDGLKAAHELKKLCPAIHIVFVTAYGQFDYAREALRLGVDEYLVKPASVSEVRDTALRVLARIEEQREASAAGQRSGTEAQRALNLLEAELRADFGTNAMDTERLRSFFSLKGLKAAGLLAIVLRPCLSAKLDAAGRRLAFRRIRELAEHRLGTAGWNSILQEGEEYLFCVAALPRISEDPAAVIKVVLDKLVLDARENLGSPVLIGSSFYREGTTALPFVSASDALALCRIDRPLALLVSDPEDAGLQKLNRHGTTTVERALAYMHAHLAEDLSLADVAAAVDSAPSHLSRLFSRQGGDTFVHVLCRLRIAAAKDLLRSGQYRVKEVCTMVGFNDQAYFSRVFRKYEGVSPVDYRPGRS
ncbi:MAG: response regulator [Spirochaetes bacterium]|nr:response regulator [Spirochaetota bacterium]MBU0956015.1 response regulator [Spirochaetota bacterium]